MQCEIWCYGDTVIWPARQARAFALVNIFNCGKARSLSSFVVVVVVLRHILLYLIVVWFVRSFVRSSSFVIPKKSAQLCTLLLARARARQMASGGFAISISGTRNRSEIMESFVSKICMFFTIDRIIPPVDFWRF